MVLCLVPQPRLCRSVPDQSHVYPFCRRVLRSIFLCYVPVSSFLPSSACLLRPRHFFQAACSHAHGHWAGWGDTDQKSAANITHRILILAFGIGEQGRRWGSRQSLVGCRKKYKRSGSSHYSSSLWFRFHISHHRQVVRLPPSTLCH